MVLQLLTKRTHHADHLKVLEVLAALDRGLRTQLQERKAGRFHQRRLGRRESLGLEPTALGLLLVVGDLLLAVHSHIAQRFLVLSQRNLRLLEVLFSFGLDPRLLGLALLRLVQGRLGEFDLVSQGLGDHLKAVLCLRLLLAELHELILGLVEHVLQHLSHATRLGLVGRRLRGLRILEEGGEGLCILMANDGGVHHGLDGL
mmetsp:Transcript_19534/g.40402  ORF Transcript_19534/g.40402 Transcript_19534/m.40402 type:complete len:202 (-) Transcript_19534:536-1141(-)